MIKGSIDDHIAGFMALSLLSTLIRRAPIGMLFDGSSSAQLAEACGAPREEVDGCLRFIAKYSDLADFRDGLFKLDSEIWSNNTTAFRLLKFLGAYGHTLGQAFGAGGKTAADSKAADPRLFADASQRLARLRMKWLPAELTRLQVTEVLELGCGAAPILRSLARLVPELRGVGVDASADMVDLASQLVAEEGLKDRLSIVHGTLEQVAAGGLDLGRFDAVVLRGVMNSLFAKGEDAIAALLHALAGQFPGSLLVISDYASTLETEGRAPETDNQDLVQLLSGQGIPPQDNEAWDRIYAKAQLRCVQRLKDRSLGGVSQFLDVLSPSAPRT